MNGSSDSIIRLKEIFLENQVHNIAELRGLSPKEFNKLDASAYAWFSSFRTELVRQLAESDGLNMCLGLKRNTEDMAIGAPMEMIIKKLSFFSQTGVILTPKFSSPGKLRRAVPETDEGIRQIDADFKKISKSRVLQHIGVASVLGVGVLCQCAPNEQIKEFGKILAGGSLITPTLNYFQLKAEKSAIIDKTPFYFPWLVHREAKKLAPR